MVVDKIIANSLAGVLIAVMNISVSVSVAALMFAGLPSVYLSLGIIILLTGTVVIGLAGTFFSDFGAVICAPRSGLAPLFAVIVSGVYFSMADAGPENILVTMVVAIMLTSMVTGLLFLFLGKLRLGGLVRYIPYPVMGGFFAGIGFILIKGGLSVAMGAVPSFLMLADASALQLGLPAIGFALLLIVGLMKFDHWATFPLILIATIAVFYSVVWMTGVSPASLAEAGWFPVMEEAGTATLPVMALSDFQNVNWAAIFPHMGSVVVIALLSAIILLLDTSGIEIITHRNLNPNKEMQVMGAANIMSGVLGGYPGVHVAADTAFTYKLGGDTRLTGLVYAAIVLATIWAGTGFISVVPTFILGGLLIYVGFDMLMDWLWNTKKDLPMTDYAIILSILGVIATVDILEGVVFGFAIALILFVYNYSRLSVIKSEARGSDHASNIDRDLKTRELLNEEGRQIIIFRLQGFIFFGTSEKLVADIYDRVTDPANQVIHYVVLDFHHVSELDISAVKALSKLIRLSEQQGFHVIFTSAEGEVLSRLQQVVETKNAANEWRLKLFNEMDEGVAWCENRLLEVAGVQKARAVLALPDILSLFAFSQEAIDKLVPLFHKEVLKQGDYLFKQGDSGRSLFLVGSGTLAVVLQSGDKMKTAHQYTAGAMLGEMAFCTGEYRSAGVIIREDAVVYRLETADFEQLQTRHADIAGAIHSYIVKLLSERLFRANRELTRYLLC